MAAGRPTDYKSEYCQKVIDFGKEGMSKAEMCLELDVARSTFDLWEKTHIEFSEAVSDAIEFSEGWWAKSGRKATFNSEGFNATSYIFNMKNRFRNNWNDKTEVDNKVTVTPNPDAFFDKLLGDQ